MANGYTYVCTYSTYMNIFTLCVESKEFKDSDLTPLVYICTCIFILFCPVTRHMSIFVQSPDMRTVLYQVAIPWGLLRTYVHAYSASQMESKDCHVL